MTKISAAIATFNEGKDIGDCLESLRSLADEIVIVDGSSTDGTREIAKRFGAKIIKATNKPMFHINKNLAMEACQGDWILQMDADERMTEALAQEIKEVTASHQSGGPVAYWLKRKNLFLGHYLKKGGQYPDPVIRLFKRGKARLPAKSVHEQMVVDGKVGCLKSDFLHHGNPSFTRYLTRENRYSTLEAVDLLKAGTSVGALNTFKFIFLKPLVTFFRLFFRHKGFVDGFPGLIFALCSGLHHLFSYIKLWEMKQGVKDTRVEKDWI